MVTLRRSVDDPIRFFLPGPTYVLHEVRQAQLRQPIAHRSPAFRELYAEVSEGLRSVFRTRAPVVTATGSATLLMEAAVASFVRRRSLHLVNGAFSERWYRIALSLEKEADKIEVPHGASIPPDLLREALRRQRYDAVTVVHSETSTGVLNPIRELAEVIREESDAIVLIDAVSSLGGARLETDDWGLDLVLTGSQKALALPPGISFVAVSERAAGRIDDVAARGFYTDLGRYLAEDSKGGTITTPAVTLYYALERQLDQILDEGMEERWSRHEELRDRTVSWARDRGVGFVSVEGFRSPTVSALRIPGDREAGGWLESLAARGFTVGPGYGPLKASSWRIGHMGEVRLRDLNGMLAAADEILGFD